MSDGFELVNDSIPSVRLFNPEGFDPRDHMPEQWWRHADSVRYFVHTLHHQRFLYHRSPDDYIEIKAAYMIPFFTDKRDYKPVVVALEEAGVLECDDHYVVGRKSLGYRLGPRWRSVPFRSFKVTNPTLVRKLMAKRAEQRGKVTANVHLYLRAWTERLELDWRSVQATATACGLEVCLPMAEMIRDRDFYFSTCEYGRVHHNVSSLQSEFRRHLSYNGQGLINLDIANSQPLLFSVVLVNCLCHKDYLRSLYSWEIDNSGLYIDLPTSLFLQEENTTPHTSPAHPLRLPTLITTVEETAHWKDTTRRLMAHGLPQDALLYIELTQRGLLYEYLMQQEGICQDKRAEFKKTFFGGVFFCKNRPVTKQARLFQSHFPSVYNVIFELKANDYRRLAHVLQRTESSLIVNRIARRCMNELPGVCVVTIHDSVLTTPDGVESVRRIMTEEFRRVGLDPTIRVEDYSSAAGRPGSPESHAARCSVRRAGFGPNLFTTGLLESLL